MAETVSATQHQLAAPVSVLNHPPNWYPDPWRIAPWRWWDGVAWTPVIYGPYGEAWPMGYQALAPFVPKGPGIKGGGIAALGAGLGFVGATAVIIGFIVGSDGNFDSNDPWYLLWSELVLWAGMIGAVLLASRRNGTGSLGADYGLSAPRSSDVGWGALGALVSRALPLIILIIFVVVGNGLGSPNSTAPKLLGLTPEGTTGWVILFAMAVVGAPIIEELFFRGLVQGAFTRRIGAVPAIFVTAVIFCVAHVLSEGPTAPIALFPAAVVLGYLRYKTGRLAAGMVAHALFNASLFALFLVPAFR
jgi:uncharacterized protein